MVQAFFPNHLFQNTVNYSALYPWCNKGPSLLAGQLVPKHCKLRCFCNDVEAMLQAFWSNNLPRNTVYYNALKRWFKHSFQTTCSKILQITMLCIHNVARQLVPKHCKLRCFLAMVPDFLPNEFRQSTANYNVLYPCLNDSCKTAWWKTL